MQEVLGIDRNPYDKIGHLRRASSQLVARECPRWLRGEGDATFICISIAMAISACYELVEWGGRRWRWGSLRSLGTQGYV
jgi:putative membrane protein